ncbi:MAG TPA: hypothetical protein PK027_04610, partial [Aquimonas sp.]|nr:hypothetical protein [Aquimonas sp.]
REDTRPRITLVFLPDEDGEILIAHRVEDQLEKEGKDPHVAATLYPMRLESAAGVIPWGVMEPPQLLAHLRELADAENLTLHAAARKFTPVDVPADKYLAWDWHPWLGLTIHR